MSITDELREWVRDGKGSLLAIADRIDAEHERRMVERADRYSELRAKMNNCYIELPKDADGVPIHVGDKLIDKDDKLQKPAIVKCILYNDEGCVVSDIDPRGCWYDPSLLRHYHAPTVEDVLREFGKGWYEQMNGPETFDIADYVEQYAAKLRLAEEEDA